MSGRGRTGLFVPVVNRDKCTGCENCVNRCKRRVFDMTYQEGRLYAIPRFEEDCVGCGKCERYCEAISLHAVEQVTSHWFIR